MTEIECITDKTLRAWLNKDRFVAERALNHKLRDVEGVYNQYDYFEERKVALERWAQLLDATVCPRNGDGIASDHAPE